MKTISITPGVANAEIQDAPRPEIRLPNEVILKVIQVGICGTDRHLVEETRAEVPEDADHLIIGHEMMGKVIEVGPDVKSVQKGDYAVVTVRRGCGNCDPCKNNRSDMCYTGEYKERGIKEMHGFKSEYVSDEEQYIVKVPEEAKSVGVLAEPMSVIEKAIDQALKIQMARLPGVDKDKWFEGKKVLIAGIGAIGLLAAIALRLRGARVTGIDIVDESSRRPQMLKKIGGKYKNSKNINVAELDEDLGQIDFIFEAVGVPQLGFDLIETLGVNGIYVMTGIPGDGDPVCIPGAGIMRRLVLNNQVILGSVNASKEHFEMGLKDLAAAKLRWGQLVEDMITSRVHYQDFEKALDQTSQDDIKTVIVWEE